MVTATTGALMGIGKQSKRTYHVSLYIDDTVGNPVRFSPNGLAGTGSQVYWIAPEDIVIRGFSIISGPTVSTVMTLQSNNNPIPAAVIPYAENYTTAPQRPVYDITIGKGNQIGATEG